MSERVARALRLSIVRGYYLDGLLSKRDAQELLRGPLSPDDPDSVVDDSALLLDSEGAARILEEADGEP